MALGIVALASSSKSVRTAASSDFAPLSMSASSRYARPQLPSWMRYCSKRARAVTETAARAPAEASAYRRKALWLISGGYAMSVGRFTSPKMMLVEFLTILGSTASPSRCASPSAMSTQPVTFRSQPPSGRCRPIRPARSLAIWRSRPLSTLALISARRTASVAMSRLATMPAPSCAYDRRYMSSSDIVPVSADCTEIPSVPCLVSANFGRYTASSWPSRVTIPPVAVVSGVRSAMIGTSWTIASFRSPGPVAVNVMRAVPSDAIFAGQLTRTESLG